jgi:hypothetical protein
MQRLMFSILLVGIPIGVHAQDLQFVDTSNVFGIVSWEKLLESAAEGEENQSTIDEVSQLEDNPIDINSAPLETLHRLPGITNSIASRIVERRKHAPFSSPEELITIEGISLEMFLFIRQYVNTGNRNGTTIVSGSFRTRESKETVMRKGFLTGAYPGTPLKSLNKIHITAGGKESPLSSTISTAEIGALSEKDPGEKKMTDFSSGFGCISFPLFSTMLILGHYQVESAEGLVFWSSTAFSKGSEVIAPTRKNGIGIHPYYSSEENNSLQGVAVSMEFRRIKIQLMYSNRSCDAAIDSLGQISSFDRSGLFRTENELRKKNSTRESLIGCRATANIFDGFKIGGTTYGAHLENPLIVKACTGETANNFSMNGLDMSFTNQEVDIFTELAEDRKNALALIGGVSYEPLSSIMLCLVGRSFPSGFQSIHGNAFGETNGMIQNEKGIYVALKFHPIDELWISTYFDQFKHPQPDLSIPVSSHGDDFLAYAECQATKKCELTFRYKRKESPAVRNGIDLYGRVIQHVVSRIQENFRLMSEFISSPSIRLENRIEWLSVTYEGMQLQEKGLLFSQAIQCKLFHSLALRARIAMFSTGSYDSRVYEYEDDLPGAFSNPALYGRGARWYLMLRCEIFRKVCIAAKYSQTIKEGVTSLGSGLDEIEGNTQSLLSMQLDIRF